MYAPFKNNLRKVRKKKLRNVLCCLGNINCLVAVAISTMNNSSERNSQYLIASRRSSKFNTIKDMSGTHAASEFLINL